MNTWHVYTARMSPTRNGSSAPQHFERSNAIEIHNEIKFNFYSGLPHLCLIYVCMYFTGEFSDIKSLENLRNFVSSASMPRTVTAPRTTAIWKFLQNIQDYALCHSYSPPLCPFLSLSCFSPLPLLSSSSLPSPLSPSSLSLLSSLCSPFHLLHSQAKWRFSDNTQTGNLSVTILKILSDNQREERHMLIKNEKQKTKKNVPCDPKLPKDQQDQWFGEGRTVTKKKQKQTLHACSISVFVTDVLTSWALATRHNRFIPCYI